VRTTTTEKGRMVTRTLVARDLDGETACFPFVAQAALVQRQRDGRAPETVALLTSRPSTELAPAPWLAANTLHWGIETGLHARLDASRHDDHCRLRRTKAVWIHGMFNRWANSIFMHWRGLQPTPRHLTTTDFITSMAENHDRRALRVLTSKNFPS
jgi:predicted transposase YbfD/YdcC